MENRTYHVFRQLNNVLFTTPKESMNTAIVFPEKDRIELQISIAQVPIRVL